MPATCVAVTACRTWVIPDGIAAAAVGPDQ